MKRETITLKNKERFLKTHVIPEEKLRRAASLATEKLLDLNHRLGFGYPGTCSKAFKYELSDVTNWESGMYTGSYWLAYQLTGNEEFKDIALSHIPSYKKNIDELVNIHDHDVGFMYSPSVVAAYKLTGDEKFKDIALRTAKFYYDNSYSKEGKFIIRFYGARKQDWGCRTMMDSLMNAPFLFWASRESGVKEYYEAAHAHTLTTEELLIREDGSSFHHYQFDPNNNDAPLKGVTFQGHKDDSCWSRGHSWGVYGFPIAYSYTRDEKLRDVHRDVTYFMLNHLPEDLVPYWDYDFSEPSRSFRDSSAAVIAVCGMLEMARNIDDEEEKAIFRNAASMIMESIIDHYTDDIGVKYDGLIHHVTHAVPFDQGFDECAVYGDYFYLEALMRLIDPDWKMYW